MMQWLRSLLRKLPFGKRWVKEHDASYWGEYVQDLDLYAVKGLVNAYRAVIDRTARKRGGVQRYYWEDLQIRDVARLLERYNPLAQGFLSGLSSYTLGDQGLSIDVKVASSADLDPQTAGVQASAQAKEDVRAVRHYLDAFRKQDNYHDRHKESFLRLHRDGEFFVRFFVDEDAPLHPVRIRYGEPEFCVPPDGSEEWTFGCQNYVDPATGRGDIENIIAYNFQYQPTPDGRDEYGGEVVPAQEVIHVKQGVDRCIKRGNSDFAAAAPLLIEAFKCINLALRAETVRQSTTWITCHPESTPTDLDQYVASQTDYLVRSYGNYGVGGTGAYPPRDYPVSETTGVQEVHLTGNQQLAAVPAAERINEALNLVNAALLFAAAKYKMPIAVLTGQMDRNNTVGIDFATPWGIIIKELQSIVARYEEQIHWRVVEIGVERGDLSQSVLENVELKFVPQQPAVKDKTEETKRLAILYQDGIISRSTWCQQEGFDDEFERNQIVGERAAGIAPPSELTSPAKIEKQAIGATVPPRNAGSNGQANGQAPVQNQ